MAKMVSLKMSKKEAKGEFGADCPQPSKAYDDNLPRYPYGTKLRLETEVLDKLDIEPGDFKSGQVLTVTAKVEVVGTSTSQRQGGKDRNELELQITDMSIDTKAMKKAKADENHLNSISGAAAADED